MRTHIICRKMNFLMKMDVFQNIGRRFPFAVRAGLCCGMPVALGYLAGDIHAGLLATIGSFTVLYGSDRPYVNRSRYLAVIAFFIAAVVILGIIVAPYPLMAVIVVAGIAAIATFICNVMRVGPPGAYIFALACASGTGMGVSNINAWQCGLYVLGGGGISWLAHMSGAFYNRYEPEKKAVMKAALLIAGFSNVTDFPCGDKRRQDAALAVDNAWLTLVSWQTEKTRQHRNIKILLSHTQKLHEIFAHAASSFLTQAPANPSLSQQAFQIAHAVNSGLSNHFVIEHSVRSPERVSVRRLIKENFVFWSVPMQLALRVWLATLLTGSIGVVLGLNYAYWGMAAVVVVLNQTYGWLGTTRRAAYRIMGTLVGLLLAWGILSLNPEGLWLALTVSILQFIIEIWVVLQYGIAAIFITTNALLIAAGGREFPEISGLFIARVLDTIIGCGIALIVFMLTVPRSVSYQINNKIKNTIKVSNYLINLLAKDISIQAPKILCARRKLLQHVIELKKITDTEATAIVHRTHQVSPLLTAVNAVEAMAWRLIIICWHDYTKENSDKENSIARKDRMQTMKWLKRLQQQNGVRISEKNFSETEFLLKEINELDRFISQLQVNYK